MTSWTQQQLDSLEAAIAEGALVVKYEDRVTEYRSLAEMGVIRTAMRKALGLAPAGDQRVRIASNKGLDRPAAPDAFGWIR